MNITLSELLVWLIIGGLVGSFVGMVVKRKKEGFGHWVNLGIGLVGAIIGGVIFNVFNIDLGLSDFAITAEDLVSAVVGAVVLLIGVWIFQRFKASKAK